MAEALLGEEEVEPPTAGRPADDEVVGTGDRPALVAEAAPRDEPAQLGRNRRQADGEAGLEGLPAFDSDRLEAPPLVCVQQRVRAFVRGRDLEVAPGLLRRRVDRVGQQVVPDDDVGADCERRSAGSNREHERDRQPAAKGHQPTSKR